MSLCWPSGPAVLRRAAESQVEGEAWLQDGLARALSRNEGVIPSDVLLLAHRGTGYRKDLGPLGSVSDEKRLDGGGDGLRAFEESVVARAGNDDELALWNRIGDRCR
jgi:hypothetical protein